MTENFTEQPKETTNQVLLEMLNDGTNGIKDLIRHFETLEKLNPQEALTIYQELLPELEQRINLSARDNGLTTEYRRDLVNFLVTLQDKVRIGVNEGKIKPLKIESRPTTRLSVEETEGLRADSDAESEYDAGTNGKGTTTGLL